jgi:FLVCR family MFS transporter
LKGGLRALVVNLKFWLVVMCMSVPLGVYSAWLNVLNINLQSFNFSQQDSGWVGFGSALAGAIGGLVSGYVADKLPKNLARLIAGLYLTSSGAMVWFTLICLQIAPYSVPAVYISSISVGFFMYGTYPLFFELVMEIVFPIPEACASAILVCTQAVVGSP